MDAATLYMVLTLPNGEQRTSTQKFATLEACERQLELLRTVEPLDRQSPITSYRCGGHNPFAFVAHYRRGRSRRLVELSSRQACATYQWIAYLRDRSPKRPRACRRYARPSIAGVLPLRHLYAGMERRPRRLRHFRFRREPLKPKGTIRRLTSTPVSGDGPSPLSYPAMLICCSGGKGYRWQRANRPP